MKDVISVIVPVYNVAEYLPACLDSILSQDYDKLEVILIDDGSPDASGAICDAYAEKDSRIRVIHQKNGGAASAKNAGLRAATGEFLAFADSDDYLEPGAYSHMLGLLKDNDADVVHCAFRDVYPDRREDVIFREGRSETAALDYLMEFPQDWTCALLWNKLYRRELYAGVFFEEGHKIDDEYFTYQGILNAKKILRDDRIVYNYRRRASSVMLSPKSRSQIARDRIDCLVKRRDTVIRRCPQLRKEMDVSFVDALTYMAEYPDNTEESIQMLKAQLKQYLRTPGNTIPPKHLWKGMAKLLLTGTETLLKRYGKEPEAVQAQDYFA